jgi:hypothetical protein
MSEQPREEVGFYTTLESLYAPRMSADLEGPYEADMLSSGERPWKLTIYLHESLLVNNPDVRLICGDRVFGLIEETPSDLPSGLFGEQIE